MNKEQIKNAIWLNFIVFMASATNIIITYLICYNDNNFSSLIMTGIAYVIPCLAECVNFLINDSEQMDYGIVKIIVIGIIVIEILLFFINVAGVVIGENTFFVAIVMASMIIYAAKHLVFTVFYLTCLKNK